MSIAELTEMKLDAIDAEFGECLSEEIAQSKSVQALEELRKLIDRRLSEMAAESK